MFKKSTSVFENKTKNATSEIKLQKQNLVFGSIIDSLTNLLILITTSNNPDVMLQSYSDNRFSALYFVTFVMIGIYVIMALVTAVVYNQFKGFFKDSMISSSFRQSLGIRSAFWVLYDQFKDDENNPGLVPKSAVCCCIQNLSINKKRKKLLLKNVNEISFCIQDTDDLPANLDMEQFEKLFLDNLNGKDNEEEDDITSEIIIANNTNSEETSSLERQLIKIRKCFKMIFETKIYMFITCLLTFINIACITLELHWFIDNDEADRSHELLSFFIFFFSIYYSLENSLKLWAFKWKRYSRDYLNLMDGIISVAFLTLQIVHTSIYGRPYLTREETRLDNSTTTIWGLSRVVNMLFIFRLIHVAPSITIMYTILSTAIDIIRSLRPLFGIMVVFYYVYALIGMQLFSNRMVLNSFNKYNKRYFYLA